MTPVLYKGDVTIYSDNGYGRLADAKSCIVKEQLNGEFTLTMTYPKTGLHAEYMLPRNLIKVKARDEEDSDTVYQVFRISKITDSLTSNDMTVEANHISYDLSGYPMPEFTATGVSNILYALKNNSLVGSHNFTFETNLANTTSTFTTNVPRSIRNCLGGEDGSLLQMFRCELEFSNFRVKVLNRRGADNGVRIAYGKNLESLVSVRATDNAYNGIVGYWYKEEDGLVKVQQLFYEFDPRNKGVEFFGEKFKILDCTDQFENKPTAAQLNSYVSSWATKNNIGKSYLDSMTVKFVPLWHTEEYKNLAILERAVIGDTVHVVYGGDEYELRVIETSYDVLKERYTSIELGDRKITIAKTIEDIAKEIANTQSSAVMISPEGTVSNVETID